MTTNLPIHLETNRLQEGYDFGKVAKQASGSVWYTQGKAVLIATVAVDDNPVEEDFLPLTVQYIEKSYAAAKIPGGFVKRESKPSDFETLTSRLVDRSLRPLFPEGFCNPVTITILVVSSDSSVDMQVAALHAASAALYTSSLPVQKCIAGVRVGAVGDEMLLNPTLQKQEESKLDLLIVGSGDDIMMIEMRTVATQDSDLIHQTNVIAEEELALIIADASKAIASATDTYRKAFNPHIKPLDNFALFTYGVDAFLYEYIQANYATEVKHAIKQMAKSERSVALKDLRQKILEALEKEGKESDKQTLSRALYAYKRKVSREMILNEQIRADGRRLDEVRPISIETNLLPSVHGSCLFTRGETQALVTVTLGDKKDAQSYELITDKNSRYEKFMVHYNFPAFSVGEAKPIGPTNRRELGHGNLAKRALEPAVFLEQDSVIRIVSEVLESNGSSSMATVCGGAMALKAAGVEMEELVAGIAMGLIYEDGKYAILTDIMGLEDHEGDMDFKIAGTSSGVSALQMDIKIEGASLEILRETLMHAKKGKNHILNLMNQAATEIVPSGALPISETFTIHPGKIVDIIGKAGSTIRDIIERFEVSVDLDREKGGVKLVGDDKLKLQEAKAHIQSIAGGPIREQMQYEIAKPYKGKIKKIVDFGLFVEMPDGFDALLHISKISKGRIDNLASLYKEGDSIEVVVLEQTGKKVELATMEFIAQ
ncbi:MAG TPA: polyribonucleotide nucleotidyltransferase [Epsilonproteobacteria bacterium]|nr:polyribonucleotide nucleotidyltransferase [Campylobacterota bacterium]